MRDEKALRAAELLKRYCAERCCAHCVFRRASGICAIQAAKAPYQIITEGLKPLNPEVSYDRTGTL